MSAWSAIATFYHTALRVGRVSSVVGTCAVAVGLFAQRPPNVPLISGGIGIFSDTNKGFTVLQPVIAPVLVAALGTHVLVESRADLRGVIQQSGPNGAFEGGYISTLEYMQADVCLSSHATLVAGRFQTPFGVYNERLTPIWIRNLQDAPLIFGIGTRTSGSSDGVMLRGNLMDSQAMQLNYVTYFSVNRKQGQFEAARTVGYRLDIYLPSAQLEVGTSYQRFLQNQQGDAFGAHVWWTPSNSGVAIRSEYAHGAHAQGYWIETAYRLSQFHGADSTLGRLQPVFRMQQSFRNSPGMGDGLPQQDTTEADFGIDYYLPHDVRLNTSYARALSTVNGNIWDVSLTYRFLLPAWRGSR